VGRAPARRAAADRAAAAARRGGRAARAARERDSRLRRSRRASRTSSAANACASSCPMRSRRWARSGVPRWRQIRLAVHPGRRVWASCAPHSRNPTWARSRPADRRRARRSSRGLYGRGTFSVLRNTSLVVRRADDAEELARRAARLAFGRVAASLGPARGRARARRVPRAQLLRASARRCSRSSRARRISRSPSRCSSARAAGTSRPARSLGLDEGATLVLSRKDPPACVFTNVERAPEPGDAGALRRAAGCCLRAASDEEGAALAARLDGGRAAEDLGLKLQSAGVSTSAALVLLQRLRQLDQERRQLRAVDLRGLDLARAVVELGLRLLDGLLELLAQARAPRPRARTAPRAAPLTNCASAWAIFLSTVLATSCSARPSSLPSASRSDCSRRTASRARRARRARRCRAHRGASCVAGRARSAP